MAIRSHSFVTLSAKGKVLFLFVRCEGSLTDYFNSEQTSEHSWDILEHSYENILSDSHGLASGRFSRGRTLLGKMAGVRLGGTFESPLESQVREIRNFPG